MYLWFNFIDCIIKYFDLLNNIFRSWLILKYKIGLKIKNVGIIEFFFNCFEFGIF